MNGYPIKENDLAMIVNSKTLFTYCNIFKMLGTSLFTWKNLDKHCGTGANRFLENVLYEEGKGVFVKDDELGYMALRVQPDDKYNVYKMPVKVIATSVGYNKEYDFDDVVYIWNNNQFIPTYELIEIFLYKLYDTERTIDTNLNAQKTPILIEGDANTTLTLKNVYAQYSGNTPVIYGNKKYNINNKLNVLKTDAPYLIDKLEVHKHNVIDDILTILGIDNANTDKKERLIVDEVESNEDLINYFLNCFYAPRKKACDEINKKFGFTGEDAISIELNKDVIKLLNETQNNLINEIQNEEGDEDGTLYSNN